MQLTREIIAYQTEAEWLAHRKQDVTSTECAGLFDAGSYENARTLYELYNVKAGIIVPAEFKDNARARWGNRLEAAIAAGIAEDCGLIVEPMKHYARIVECRIGASFDFKIIGIVDGFDGDETARDMFREHGAGIMEVKNIDALQFRRNWIDDGDTIEATPQIEFQVQHQLEVADMAWSLIAPLVGGNTPKVVIRKRDTDIGDLIRAKALTLWGMVAAGHGPQPDYLKDADTIAKVHLNNDGSSIDLSCNPRVGELCRAYKAAAADAKAADERKSAAKSELLTIVKAAKAITLPGFKISAGTNKESFRAYYREGSERMTISISQVPGCDIEATVAPFRNLRVSETA